MANAPVKGTPAGAAPKTAPSQTIAVTGKGPTPKGLASSGPTPAKIPARAGKGKTHIAAPKSVDYFKKPTAPVKHLGASAANYASEQSQQLQDAAGA
jgi:hypothetical protein